MVQYDNTFLGTATRSEVVAALSSGEKDVDYTHYKYENFDTNNGVFSSMKDKTVDSNMKSVSLDFSSHHGNKTINYGEHSFTPSHAIATTKEKAPPGKPRHAACDTVFFESTYDGYKVYRIPYTSIRYQDQNGDPRDATLFIKSPGDFHHVQKLNVKTTDFSDTHRASNAKNPNRWEICNIEENDYRHWEATREDSHDTVTADVTVYQLR
ncbi:hypothetical protein V865_004250 [Kwoniella europaea PYCC6329]|uniref:Uncharacterized protein n=1 Tax=Kwoniella europaea PYCC6329 TaxID=1423913 RepID=A0AAX4KKV2_9TREE